MARFLLCIFIICSLVACGKKNNYPQYSEFPVERHLTAQAISLDTVLFRFPFRIQVQDSVAIISDMHNADHYLHAFSIPSWEHIISFGRRGEAPEEMISCETFRFHSLDSIWALDPNRMEVSRWSVSLQNQTAERVENIPLNLNLIRILDFYKTESGFIVPDYLGKNRYSFLSESGDPILSYSSIPTIKHPDLKSTALAQAWRSFIDYSPEKDVLVMATQLGEVLEIYNLKDTTHTILYGPNGEPVFGLREGQSVPTGIMGFSDIQITNNYIYAVFHGTSFWEINSALNRKERLPDGGKYIYQFDLEGNPVCKYVLDRYIYGIDIHEDEGIFYATDINTDEPLLQYTLP